MLLDNDQFLGQLKLLFENKRSKGTVFITQKRYSFRGTISGDDSPMVDTDQPVQYPCLMRATDGKATKLSTLVQPEALHQFSSAYGILLKSSMTSLRKRNKKKDRRKPDARKGKGPVAASLPKVVGPRRGNGRKRRQASLKARLRALVRLRAARQRDHEGRKRD